MTNFYWWCRYLWIKDFHIRWCVRASDFWSDELFFSDEFRNKLDADAFYDSVETLHKTGTLATDDAVSNSGEKDKAGRKELYSGPQESIKTTPIPSEYPLNQDYDTSNSEDES